MKVKKAVSVACCDQFCVALGESGRVFKEYYDYLFTEVEELQGEKIVDISGTRDHCFAVCKDGKVFVYGYDSSGALCLANRISKTVKFTKVTSLEKYKILKMSQ